MEGTSGGVPFRAVSGTPGPDGRLAVKISGGGDAHPRFEADARFGLLPQDNAKPSRWNPRARPASWSVRRPRPRGPTCRSPLSAAFKARGRRCGSRGWISPSIRGGRTLRLGGTGRLDLRQWRAGLSLEARRLDLDAFLASTEGQNLIARGLPSWGGALPAMLDLDLAVGSAMLGGDEWSNLALTGTLERAGGLLLRRFSVTGPAESTLSVSGQSRRRRSASPARWRSPPPIRTRSAAICAASVSRGRSPRCSTGAGSRAAADLSADAASLSLRNLRLGLGNARITGNARYTAAEAGARGRFDAQIRANGIDIAALPPVGTTLGTLRDLDLALTLEARDVRYGTIGSGNGTIAASIQTDGASVVVDSLAVTDLAGASATLSGRIGATGPGASRGA